MNKLLIICGPTATGKTELGVHLAKKFDGEIVSADSRQVYRGMDIVTGKDISRNEKFNPPAGGQNSKLNIKNKKFSVGYRLKEGIPVWLVDIVEPDYIFSAGEYSILAHKVIKDIWSRKKLPIVVGGTGFYIKATIDPIETVLIPSDKELREKLEVLDKKSLQQKLKTLNLQKWDSMNESDRQNPRRLIRAIEIAMKIKNGKLKMENDKEKFKMDKLLMIGLRASYKLLYQRIDRRVEERVEGALAEVKELLEQGYFENLPSFTSTGFSHLKDFLGDKISLPEAVQKWKYQEHGFARRQMTWFKKDKRIAWFYITEPNYTYKIEDTVGRWYT
ncbi:tRNA dimethylallyltransferase [Candidatus Gottesmanbacteria bacterium]|nr:tRNA dimethylallyltransferase [Candidatus Gottesmanbacteria bacterium]MBI5451970.1 tRNA dimethylallyltransferase [Candidatus Gottesmanbacteria bacterium]